ncbi:MAG: hypothetical protein AABX27_01125 [Nanoarchaeota archaeon]
MKSLTETVLEDALNLESYSYSVLYSSSSGSGGNSGFGNAGYAPLLTVVDMPGLGGQVHIHGYDRDHLTGGRLYSYDYSTFKPLNGYEVSMADSLADSLGLKKIDKF